MQPGAYDVKCDLCEGPVEWSEFEHMVWCPKCEKDTPGTDGIFDGPIPYEVAKMIGISFDRIDLKTGKRLYMQVKNGKSVWKSLT